MTSCLVLKVSDDLMFGLESLDTTKLRVQCPESFGTTKLKLMS